MSWLLNPRGDGSPALTDEDKLPKVPDPSNPDRMVSAKKANQPFLACVLLHCIVCARLKIRKDTNGIRINAKRNTMPGNNA